MTEVLRCRRLQGLKEGALPDHLGYEINWLVTSGAFRKLVRSILCDTTRMATLACESYKHDNGFLKLLIFRPNSDLWRLRLHVWPKTDGSGQNVHDHRFDFWSIVLRGSLGNQLWEPGPGESWHHYHYHPREGKNQYAMEHIISETLQPSKTFDTAVGKQYFFSNRWLHTIVCRTGAVTLMAEDRRHLRPYANVFSKHYAAAEIIVPAPALSTIEYRRALSPFADEA
jgi:hypothetical protein